MQTILALGNALNQGTALVEQLEAESAAKVNGMLLEMESPDALKAKVYAEINQTRLVIPLNVLKMEMPTSPLGNGSVQLFFTHVFQMLAPPSGPILTRQMSDPSILSGCVPFLKQLIFTPDAPLYFFADTCLIIGDAMIPCILLALGANLTDGPGSSKLGLKTTAAIIFGRLVLVSPAGLGIMTSADKLGFLPTDDTYIEPEIFKYKRHHHASSKEKNDFKTRNCRKTK
ncbi:hypothetical protein L1987_24864 [Smallanthus sonchifolius]|uniref:Uncharacterized protein n=1 Tax=Smallanthus sonchifolius TaxID=185202 RepID=A0ACB9IN34_9ASTR|nr:hypothetical protein L1987_24864 [Smallanthus sonchifolius]